MSESDKNKLEAALKAKIAKAKNPEAAKNILALLFPKAENVLHTYLPSMPDRNERKISRRLSQKDFAENYFTLSPNADSWGRVEFESILSESPEVAFHLLQKKLEGAQAEKRSYIRRVFLELLDSKFSLEKNLDQRWFDAIIAESPDLLSEQDKSNLGLFSFDNEDRIRRMLLNGLKKLPQNERIEVLRSAISSANDLTILADIVRSVAGDKHPEGSTNKIADIAFGEESNAIRQLLADRIRNLAASGEIWSQARPDRLLWFWWGTDAENEVKEFTGKATNTPAGVRGLLKFSVSSVNSTGGDYERVARSWNKIVDLDALREKALTFLNSPNDDDVRLASRFLEALNRGEKDDIY